MTPQEIIEGNKLIAEFYGWEDTGVLHPYGRSKFNLYQHPTKAGQYWIEKMQYHSSWDWLMSVVQKIWGITNCSDSIFCFTVGYKTYIMPENNTGNYIDRCWFACIAFIKWYNQNKS